METLNQAILYKEKRRWVAIIFMFSFYELNKQLDFYYK
ncbi:Whole genome shotgun sequence [Vibrio parahaemolyticus]